VKSTENLATPKNSPTVLGLSFVAGLGLVALMLALGMGVIGGANADGGVIGLLFVSGLAFLLVGFVGWLTVVQPQRHFDDINQPAADEHHGHADHAHADEHAELPAQAGQH
jgi:hypothetical protein